MATTIRLEYHPKKPELLGDTQRKIGIYLEDEESSQSSEMREDMRLTASPDACLTSSDEGVSQFGTANEFCDNAMEQFNAIMSKLKKIKTKGSKDVRFFNDESLSTSIAVKVRDISYSEVETKFKKNLEVFKKSAKRNGFMPRANKLLKWNEDEILLLVFLVQHYCKIHDIDPVNMTIEQWDLIASMFPRRSGEICQEKWLSLHQVSIHHAPWTPNEDSILLDLIKKYGLRKWAAIAREMNQKLSNPLVFRQGKQCRERWINHLDPSINKGDWDYSEEVALMKAVLEHGKKWATISKVMVNRTENAVKNRWKILMRRHGIDPRTVRESEVTDRTQRVLDKIMEAPQPEVSFKKPLVLSPKTSTNMSHHDFETVQTTQSFEHGILEDIPREETVTVKPFAELNVVQPEPEHFEVCLMDSQSKVIYKPTTEDQKLKIQEFMRSLLINYQKPQQISMPPHEQKEQKEPEQPQPQPDMLQAPFLDPDTFLECDSKNEDIFSSYFN